MSRVHDTSKAGLTRRYDYALTHLKLEIDAITAEVGDQVILAALFTALREIARDSGMAPCQYQMLLIDELGLINAVRRTPKPTALDASDPGS